MLKLIHKNLSKEFLQFTNVVGIRNFFDYCKLGNVEHWIYLDIDFVYIEIWRA